MAPQISSLSCSCRFSFAESDCLYRGFNGERILVDCEQAGTLFVHRVDPRLTLVRGGQTVQEFPLVFRDTLMLGTPEEGAFLADVQSEIPSSVMDLEPRRCVDRFEGAGWLIGGQGICQIDSRHEPISVGEFDRPIPIFSSLIGAGVFEVVPDPSTTCVLADAWDIADVEGLKQRGWTVQNISRLRQLDSEFSDGANRVAQVASHLNAAVWTSPIPENNKGIFLRKYYDRFHGRQRARVFVDGEVVGVWYLPRENRLRRWAVSDFGLPPSVSAGKSCLSVSIDPPSGVSLWSVSRVEIWALVPA
jgi:hypothetical protein